MPIPKMIWFDFGGVLSPTIPALLEQYEVKTGISPEILLRAMMDVAEKLGVPMLAPIENAMLSEFEWGERLEIALRFRHPNMDLSRACLTRFGEQWFDGVSANTVMVNTARQLKTAGFKVGILTNNVVEWDPFWRSMVKLDDVVDLIVDSSKEGCRKPDSSFFAIACQRAGVDPVDNLLIDDIEENIDAARKMNWQVIQFTDNASVLHALEMHTGVMFKQSTRSYES